MARSQNIPLVTSIGVMAAVACLGLIGLWRVLDVLDASSIELTLESGLENWTKLGGEEFHSWSLADFPMTGRHESLVRMDFGLPHAEKYPFHALTESKIMAERCNLDQIVKAQETAIGNDPRISKLLAWIAYRCGARTSLPTDFFEQPPYMHPNGASYMLMWSQLKKIDPDLSRLHVTELGLTQAGRQWLMDNTGMANLTRIDFSQIAKSSPLIEVGGRIHILRQTDEQEHYVSVPKARFHEFFESAGICVTPEGPVAFGGLRFRNCSHEWPLSRSHLLFGTILATTAIGGLSIFAAASAARSRMQALGRQRFMIKMLTHELRTPASGIQLSLREIEPEFDRLSERGQEALIRLQGAQVRLGGVLEASKLYLRSGFRLGGDSETCKVNDAIRACIGFDGPDVENEIDSHKVQSTLLSSDTLAVRMSPFWFTFCLSNLLDNARRHGTPPFAVSARALPKTGSTKAIAVSVTDGGHWDLENKSAKAANGGLGIGFSLVAEVARAFGGRLEVSQNPTTVSLILKVAK